jgi:hypothetical protein
MGGADRMFGMIDTVFLVTGIVIGAMLSHVTEHKTLLKGCNIVLLFILIIILILLSEYLMLQ